MAEIHFLADFADARLDDYRNLKDHLLNEASGKFIAESEMVVAKLLGSDFEVQSVLLTAPRLATLAPTLADQRHRDVPVFVVPQHVVDQVTGLAMHRGCLAVGVRPTAAVVPPHARAVLVLEDLVDVANVGALARNAAAFDVDAVVLSPGCADPFYRKAIRTSMGATFTVPIIRARAWPQDLIALRDARGLTLVGAVLDDNATPLPTFRPPERYALLLGAEGPGLRAETKSLCDALVTIPMARSRADSLNVATAGAVLLYGLRR